MRKGPWVPFLVYYILNKTTKAQRFHQGHEDFESLSTLRVLCG
jgi:hypothetical protein